MATGLAIESSAFRRALRKCSEEVQVAATSTALWSGLAVLEGLIKVNIVSQDLIKQGRLLNGWNMQVFPRTGKQAYGTIGTNIVYARIHEYGGIIRPRTAKMLIWQDSEGYWHFAKSVTITAKPYFRPAFDTGGPQVNEAFAQSIAVELRKWGAR